MPHSTFIKNIEVLKNEEMITKGKNKELKKNYGMFDKSRKTKKYQFC